MAEAIEMPFASRIQVGKHLLHIADRFEANTVLRSFNIIQTSSYHQNQFKVLPLGCMPRTTNVLHTFSATSDAQY